MNGYYIALSLRPLYLVAFICRRALWMEICM